MLLMALPLLDETQPPPRCTLKLHTEAAIDSPTAPAAAVDVSERSTAAGRQHSRPPHWTVSHC